MGVRSGSTWASGFSRSCAKGAGSGQVWLEPRTGNPQASISAPAPGVYLRAVDCCPVPTAAGWKRSKCVILSELLFSPTGRMKICGPCSGVKRGCSAGGAVGTWRAPRAVTSMTGRSSTGCRAPRPLSPPAAGAAAGPGRAGPANADRNCSQTVVRQRKGHCITGKSCCLNITIIFQQHACESLHKGSEAFLRFTDCIQRPHPSLTSMCST